MLRILRTGLSELHFVEYFEKEFFIGMLLFKNLVKTCLLQAP
jgi:hypothetical protein